MIFRLVFQLSVCLSICLSVWNNLRVFSNSKGLIEAHSLSSIFHRFHIAEWSFKGILSEQIVSVLRSKKKSWKKSAWDAILHRSNGSQDTKSGEMILQSVKRSLQIRGRHFSEWGKGTNFWADSLAVLWACRHERDYAKEVWDKPVTVVT